MSYNQYHVVSFVRCVFFCLLLQCPAAASLDYLSLLQFKATAVRQDKVGHVDMPSEVDVPELAGKSRSDVMCMLKNALENATGFEAVRMGDEINVTNGYRTCAVVSNGGILRKYEYGPEIDKASVVIRFNEAPTLGYEDMVGSKEDIRIVNEKVVHEFLGDRFGKKHEDQSITKQMGPGSDYFLTCTICGVGRNTIMDPADFKSLQQQAVDKDPNLQLFASDLSLEIDLFKFIHDTYMNTDLYDMMWDTPAGPTSGAIGMVVALSLCDEVHAYGMIPGTNAHKDENTPYHYYQVGDDDPKLAAKELKSVREWHRSFDAERDFWRRLAMNPVDEIHEDKVVMQGFSQFQCHAHSKTHHKAHHKAHHGSTSNPSSESTTQRPSASTLLPHA